MTNEEWEIVKDRLSHPFGHVNQKLTDMMWIFLFNRKKS